MYCTSLSVDALDQITCAKYLEEAVCLNTCLPLVFVFHPVKFRWAVSASAHGLIQLYEFLLKVSCVVRALSIGMCRETRAYLQAYSIDELCHDSAILCGEDTCRRSRLC